MLHASWFLTGLIVGMVFVFAMYEYQFRRALRRVAFRDKLSVIRSHAVTLPSNWQDMAEMVRLEYLSPGAYHYRHRLFGGVRGI